MFFGGVTIARIAWAIATLNSYEQSFLDPHRRNHYLFAASTEERLFLLSSIMIGGLCIVAKHLNHKPQMVSRLYAFAMGGAIAAAGIVVVHYEHSPFLLKTGLSMGVMLLLLLLMCLDAVPQRDRPLNDHSKQDSQSRETRLRQRLVMTLSFIFLMVMLTQSFMWTTAIYQLRAVMVASPTNCMERYSHEFDWLYQGSYTMLNNWTLPILTLLQGDRAMPTVLIAETCQGYETSGIVDLYPWGDTPKDKLRPQL